MSEPQPAAGGLLWPVSGTGEIRLGERRWQIATGADEDPPDVIRRGVSTPIGAISH